MLDIRSEVGTNDMLGTEFDLNRNLLDLIAAAGLTSEESTSWPAPAQTHSALPVAGELRSPRGP